MLVSFDFNFNPLPPHGGRPNDVLTFAPFSYFNPLPPHGGRLLDQCRDSRGNENFNPLPPHGGRLERCVRLTKSPISIHSLRMEGDAGYNLALEMTTEFQSTPSAWRETTNCTVLFCASIHFNPLPPHGGRLDGCYNFCVGKFISIHSLRMEGDTSGTIDWDGDETFQSTPSAWRETGTLLNLIE